MDSADHALLLSTLLKRDTVKALSLTQPWATAMAIGVKRRETRSWRTTYQGPVAIHAARSFPREAEALCEDWPFSTDFQEVGIYWKPHKAHNAYDLPLGKIIAVGWLEEVECITSAYRVRPAERAYGNYTSGRYAWFFPCMYPLRTPLAARGSLGLWTWQPPESFWDEIQAAYDQERAIEEEIARENATLTVEERWGGRSL